MQLRGIHASHIHANCDCEFAIRFDQKSDIEGYEPERYYEMYMNADPSNDPVKKINALRVMLNELNRHKEGNKVMITAQAIQKVKRISITGIKKTDAFIQQTHKDLLNYSKKENDSNEVAVIVNLDANKKSEFIKGDQYSVDLESHASVYHMLRTSEYHSLAILHNHPGLSYFSYDDLMEFIRRPQVKVMTIVTNQGKI